MSLSAVLQALDLLDPATVTGQEVARAGYQGVAELRRRACFLEVQSSCVSIVTLRRDSNATNLQDCRWPGVP